MFVPILAAEYFRLFLQLVRHYTFEQANDLVRKKLRRCSNIQMHMVVQTLNCQYLKPVLYSIFYREFFPSHLNRLNQNFYLIAQYPNQLIFDPICAVWTKVGFYWLKPILAKERGFLHSYNRSGFRCEET